MTKEDMNETKANLMTQATKDRLEREHKLLKEQLLRAGESIGEAAGLNMDWHDNPAFDMAQEDFKRVGILEAQMEDKLRHTQIIEPRTETDIVGLGNTVRVRFKDMEEDEMFTILGKDDGLTGKEMNPRWVSIETPLAKAILGKARGDRATFNETQEVKIKEILPGQF